MIQLSKWYRSIFKDEPAYKKPKPAPESIFRDQPKITQLPDFSGIKHPDVSDLDTAKAVLKEVLIVSSSISRFNRK